jgi:hypothetical protein
MPVGLWSLVLKEIAAALFFVFDVLASDWEDMLTELALFGAALRGFGQAAEWASTGRQKWSS